MRSFPLVMVLFFQAIGAQAEGENRNGVILDKLEASVNGAIGYCSDVEHFRRTICLRSQLYPFFAQTSLAKAALEGSQISDREIVEALVGEQLILGEFPVGDEEAQNQISSILATHGIKHE